MKSIVHRLITLLNEKNLKLALAESVTCGMAANKLNIVKGTSEAFLGSIVCYNEKVKTDLLKVNPSLIEKFTAESQEVTDALAQNLGQFIPADVCAAITGLSAAGGSEGKSKPVGTVFFSIIYQDELSQHRKVFLGQPQQIKKQACQELYTLLIKRLENS